MHTRHQGPVMMDMLDKTKRYLWAFVEIGFAGILAIMLIYLILGQSAGVFVLAVADNVIKFAGAVPTPSLIGLALIIAIIYLIMQRLNAAPPQSDRTPKPPALRPPRK
jgi:ABC-type protease/lipase transport system fused ATPase/permease subunit